MSRDQAAEDAEALVDVPRAARRPLLGAFITVFALLAFLGAALVATNFCSYRALLPIEIDPNEAWNAWQSKALDHLYPALDALVINNYPPLYFYVLNGFERYGYEPIYAGRLLSIAAALLLTLTAYGTARELGARRLGSAVGAAWFLATISGAYTGYVGMNDPNLPALAVMAAGFLWLVARQNRGQSAEPAILVMVLAGFIKHNIGAIPLAALIWLAFDNPWRALRGAVFGAAACAIGLAICQSVYGHVFFDQLLLPRYLGWKNFHYEAESLQPLIGAAFLCCLWLLAERQSNGETTPITPRRKEQGVPFEAASPLPEGGRQGEGAPLYQSKPADFRIASKMAVLLLLTGVSGFIQRLGDGVDHNAYFEFLFALAVGVGLAMGKTEGFLGEQLFRFAGAITLMVTLAISSQHEPYRYLTSEDFRTEIKDNAGAVDEETARIRDIGGDVSCSVMLVCYWAGKPFVWDDFAMKERVVTGKWTQAELDRQAKLHRIRFETIDDRTVW